MKKYAYNAINKKGEKITGILEARSPEELANVLLESGLSPVKITERVDFSSVLNRSLTAQTVPSKEKVVFLREFATMVSAGLSVDDALEVGVAQSTNKVMKDVLNDMTKSVRSGGSLSSSMAKYPKVFSNIETNLVKAGEVSGKLDTILLRLADDIEKSSLLRGKVRGALIYPAFVLIVAGVVVSLVTVKLVPAVQGLYEGFGASTLPLPTEILVGISNALTGYWWLIILVVLLAYLFVRYYFSTPDGRLARDKFLLQIPIVGSLLGKYTVVTFIKTYAMLIASGIPVITSLNLVGDSLGNRLFSDAIDVVSKEVERGVSLAVALSKYEFIPSILWRAVMIGEETGKTEDILNKVGAFFEEQVNDSVNNLTRLLEPILLVVLGGIVAFIAIAIYLPIYNFSSVIH